MRHWRRACLKTSSSTPSALYPRLVALVIHCPLQAPFLIFSTHVWVGVFGLLAGIASWRSGWKATARTGVSVNDISAVEPSPEKLAPHIPDPLEDLSWPQRWTRCD
ncbi:hypothetical protein A0H81_08046 [Grifola frondosa]|uniref:Uncharacterized protein n=1 Tax=Grifola frondosa TaxID=5627 RepID=A0A1C7M5N1_GRIFR|nr:hypothetical protein A0H81_08046 [Grifola frondosa]